MVQGNLKARWAQRAKEDHDIYMRQKLKELYAPARVETMKNGNYLCIVHHVGGGSTTFCLTPAKYALALALEQMAGKAWGDALLEAFNR